MMRFSLVLAFLASGTVLSAQSPAVPQTQRPLRAGVAFHRSGPTADSPQPSAFREQLGLRLEPRTGPVEVLVIDSVERPRPD